MGSARVDTDEFGRTVITGQMAWMDHDFHPDIPEDIPPMTYWDEWDGLELGFKVCNSGDNRFPFELRFDDSPQLYGLYPYVIAHPSEEAALREALKFKHHIVVRNLTETNARRYVI